MRGRVCLSSRCNILAILAVVAGLWACQKERPQFGEQFLPEGDHLGVRHAVARNFSVSTDSVVGNPAVMFARATLGQIQDPVFGGTTARFATEMYPVISKKPTFSASSTIDSATFVMHLGRSYSDSKLKVRIYILKRPIKRGDSAVVDSSYIGPLLLETVLEPNTTTLRAALPLDWSKEFLLKAVPKASKIQEWTGVFPGIRVEALRADGGMGRMLTYNAYDTRNGFRFYWKEGGKAESLAIQPTLASARYSTITRDFSGSKLGDAITTPPATQAKSGVFYLASNGGARGVVDFSEFRKQWLDSVPVTFMRAELRIPLAKGNAPFSDTLIRSLHSYYKDEEGKYQMAHDMKVGAKVYRGLYNRENGYFSLNLTLFMQQLLAGGVPNNTLYVVPDNERYGYGRAVMSSPSSSDSKPMELVLTYTKL